MIDYGGVVFEGIVNLLFDGCEFVYFGVVVFCVVCKLLGVIVLDGGECMMIVMGKVVVFEYDLC